MAVPIKTKKESLRETLIHHRNKDREMVRGKFIFHEVPGGSMRFSVKLYKDDPVESFELFDNQIYTIPRGVARHLNKNCWYPVHSYAVGDNGKPSMNIGQKVRRCSFQSLEFMDDDEGLNAAPNIITVENI